MIPSIPLRPLHAHTQAYKYSWGGEEGRERKKETDRDRETEGDGIREHIIFPGKN